MKKSVLRKIFVLLCAAAVFSAFAVTAFAENVDFDDEEEPVDNEVVTFYVHEDGWFKDGGYYFYYKNGKPVTGLQTIDGILYNFTGTGIYVGKYTGWTKSKSGMRYFSNGECFKNTWLKSGDARYYAGPDGYLRTGWVAMSMKSGDIYYFDKNGKWDGKTYTSGYKPATLGDFLKDFDYGDDLDYEIGMNYDDYEEFGGIKTVMKLLNGEKADKLFFDSVDENGKKVRNSEIYLGKTDIVIRCDGDTDIEDKCPGLVFSKDKDGNCYLYCSYFGFGCKLSDDTIYDTIDDKYLKG